MSRVLAAVMLTALMQIGSASARENPLYTQFPVRTLLYSLEIQNLGIDPEKIKSAIVEEANKIGTYGKFEKFADLEAVPLAQQTALATRIEQSEIEDKLPSLSLFNKRRSPLREHVDLLVAAKVVKNAQEAENEILRYYRHVYQDENNNSISNVKSFADLERKLSFEIQAKFVRAFGIPGNNVTLERLKYAKADYLKLIRSRIESRLKGQPEAIEKVMAIEKEKIFYGYNRQTPEHLVLMGLPGTGKDTLVEAWVDAIQGYEGAWKDHMFRVPILKTKADLWGLIGSATGYVGSSELSPFLRWLVAHSAGRYKVASVPGQAPYIIENNEWAPGVVLAGYQAPEDSVLFVNEFHNWGKTVVDSFLKQALEKGYFDINNPGKGINRMYVPVNIVIATNSGINLIASRELNGQRFGPPLSYEQMMERWKNVQDDPVALKNELSRLNGLANMPSNFEGAPGVSEEFLDRLRNIVLLRPLAKETMREISLYKIRQLQDKLNEQTEYKAVRLRPTAELIDFMLNYEYSAEKSGRSYDEKIAEMIEKPLIDAFLEGKINVNKTEDITLGIQQNPDKTANLVVIDEMHRVTPIAIPYTEKDRERQALTAEEIDHLATLKPRIRNHVVGVEDVIEQITKRILVSEDSRRAKVTAETAINPAQSYMFLGPSSTGKNELAKALAKELFKDPAAYVLIDFSRVQTKYDLEQLILGIRDGNGNGIPSPFMKAYDRLQGRAIFVFDEIANAPKEVLKALYDILREPVVTTFSDGKPRVMSNSIIIMTGNAGEEWYLDIPRDVPEIEQQEAMAEIYRQAIEDPDFVRKFLESKFSPALLNRVGVNNIFFFPGLNFKSVRALTILKLKQSLKAMLPVEGRYGWNVGFASQSDLLSLIETIEDQGFVLWEQGASLDRYVKDSFENELRHTLITNKVASGKQVIIQKIPNAADNKVDFLLKVDGSDTPLHFSMITKNQKKKPKTSDVDKILTAAHEAGHEVVRHVLFGDKLSPDLISIVPGVTQIGGRWIRYLGIAKYDVEEDWMQTREAVIFQMAQLAAGEVAQTLVTVGSRHDAGKSNDMERASQLATNAILKWGLSEKWGRAAIPPAQDLQTYINSLSQERRQLFESELTNMILEARQLARQVLIANFDHLLMPLSLKLAEFGTVKSEELEKIYEANKEHEVPGTSDLLPRLEEQFDSLHPDLKKQSKDRDAKLLSELPKPTRVANVDLMRKQARDEARAQVEIPAEFKIVGLNAEKPNGLSIVSASDHIPQTCQALFFK